MSLKRSELKRSPEKIREWNDRSRAPLASKPIARNTGLRATALKPGTAPMKRGGRVRPVSPKRAEQKREYSKRRLVYLAANPWCARCVEIGALCHATDIHHRVGCEGALLLDERYWIGLCRECHQWATDYPIQAKAAGWSGSRIAHRAAGNE